MSRLRLFPALLLLLVGNCLCQVTPGLPPFAAFDRHEVDTVDLTNNNIFLRVPVMAKPGAIDFALTANSYMSAVGTWAPSMASGASTTTGAPFTASAYGLLGGPTKIFWTTTAAGPACAGLPSQWLSGFYYYTPDGTRHIVDPTARLKNVSADSPCNPQSATFFAIDNSGLSFKVISTDWGQAEIDGQGVYLRNGANIGGALVDANGNTLKAEAGCSSTSCVYQDLMGLAVVSMSTPSGITQPHYAWTDVNAGGPSVNQSVTNLTLKTNFGCGTIADLNNASTTPMTTGFSFPDGTSLGLSYEGTPGSAGKYTGRINTITLREGGTVSYTYGVSNNGIDCGYQTVPVLTRTLGNGDQTTYTLTHPLISGSNYSAVNTVVDPGGNKTVYTFTGFTSTGPAAAPTAQALTQVQRYQGTTTLLTTDVYCYNTAFASCSFTGAPSATVTMPVTSKIIFHKINGMTTTSATEYHYDAYGSVTYVANYDFGGSTPVRTVTTAYGTCTASCNTASPTITSIGSPVTILDHPGKVVTTLNGNTVAQTNYAYDTHGNLLNTYSWTGTQWLNNTTANVYNTNGTPSKTYDLANHETDYAYAAASYIGCAACTQFPYPTQIKDAASGNYVNTKWYGAGGVKSTDTDRNGAVMTYCYNTGASCSGGTADPYWRPLQVIDPLNSIDVITYPTGSAPDTANTSFTFNSGSSINSVTSTTDPYGRPTNSQTAQSPAGSSYDTVSESYSYAAPYFVVKSSQPCSTTLGANCATLAHTNKFDPLGRLFTESTASNETLTHTYTQNDDLAVLTPAPAGENSKQVQNQYDGLGRPTSTCQISSTVSGNVLCGQNTNTSAHGIVTTMSYTSAAGSTTASSTRGSQTRSQTFDALGRLTGVTIPEGNPPGATTTLVYDSGGGCGSTQNGQLVALAHPRDGQCLFYDSAGRLTEIEAAITWPNFTACRWFYYDNSTGYAGAIPPGITVTNGFGRLVEAVTDSCVGTHTSTSFTTDEWFSYDKDGRMTDIWEKTPHSTQYYHSVATFFENGTVKTLQLASPSLYTMTYTLNGEGRWNSLTESTTPQNIVTAATFFPAANPAQVTLTGSDNDKYTFDANTGNMSQFVFTAGTKNETGALTWNLNGTLKQLAITDGFNAGGTQTCHFNPTDAAGTGYDDLMRLVGADCGSGQWGQTFGYDQYDNLSKTVITGRPGSTYNPGYSSTTNHCSICTYDLDGNVTADGSNTYGWDEFAKLKWTATSGTPTCGSTGQCITYDAFGRMVENSSGGAYTEMWITQLGTIVQMAGATPNYGYFPAPEGGTAIINGNRASYGYLHKDWLGSARIVSSITGHGATVDQAFSPYGEIYDQFGSTSSPYDMFAEITQNFAPGVMWDTPGRELSVVGRWLNPDPAGQGWNQYGYPTNPNTYIDPSGLWCSAPSGVRGGADGSADTPCNSSNCPECSNPGGFTEGFNAWGPPWSGQITEILPGGGPGGVDGGTWNEWDLPMPSLYQTIWADVLGLPTGLNCPHTGGVFSPLCGGFGPIMDAEPIGLQNPQLRDVMNNVSDWWDSLIPAWLKPPGCNDLNSWAKSDARMAANDAGLAALMAKVFPPGALVLAETAKVEGSAAFVEKGLAKAICH